MLKVPRLGSAGSSALFHHEDHPPMTDDRSLSRRQAWLGASALGATAAVGSGAPALAKAPLINRQPAYFYRFPFGKGQVTLVSDGPLPLGKPADTMKGVPEAELTKSLADNFLPVDSVVLEQNIPILNTGSRVVMFDTGMGFSKAFGATTGRLLKSLSEAGIGPGQVDDIVISHAHIDHIGGLSSAKGQRLFPKATIHIAQADYDFWTDEKKLSNKDLGMFVKHARDNLLPYKDRIKWVADGKEVVPGVTAMAAPGHTVGHTIYLIENDGKKIAFTGDVTHHQILLTEKPRTEFAYDTDPKQAVQSRLKVFDMLSKDRIPMLAYHFPWPGVGYLGKAGTDTYRFYATPMTLVPIPPKKA
jgi:glyoxylase-like metal-dependent hydrolase (beta-lactamase superfamily II)